MLLLAFSVMLPQYRSTTFDLFTHLRHYTGFAFEACADVAWRLEHHCFCAFFFFFRFSPSLFLLTEVGLAAVNQTGQHERPGHKNKILFGPTWRQKRQDGREAPVVSEHF